MPLRPHSRTVALVRLLSAMKLRTRPHPRGRMPRQQQPDAIRLEYFKAIWPLVQGQLKFMRAAGQEALHLLVEERRDRGTLDGLVGFGHRADVADRKRRAAVAIDLAGRAAANAFRPRDLHNVAERFGDRTVAFQREQLDAQVRAAIGVPFSAIERPIRNLVPEWSAQNVALVKTVADRYHDRLRASVEHAFETGEHPETLAERIVELEGISESDAMRIARDQIGKLNADVNQARQESLGVTGYIWRTMNDNRVRDEHSEREGDSFQWDSPPDDGHPGEAVQCRCYAEPDFGPIATGTEEG